MEEIEYIQKMNVWLKKELAYYKKSSPDFAKALDELRQKYKGIVSNLRIRLDVESRKSERAQESIRNLQGQIKQIREQKAKDFEKNFIKKVQSDMRKEKYRLSDKEAMIFGRIQLVGGLSLAKIADYCRFAPSTVQYYANKLQMRGLVETRDIGRERKCYIKKRRKKKESTEKTIESS